MGNIRVWLGKMRRLPNQIIQDKKVVDEIKKTSTNQKTIFYFGVPEHSNLGDMAQYFCIRTYIGKYFPDYQIQEIFTRNYLDNTFGLRDYLKNRISKDDLIFCQSGYCTQDIGGREDLMHQAVILDYPKNRIVILPQTVFFQDEKRRKQASKVYSSHKNLLFLARDQVSFELAEEMFNGIQIGLYPDIVTTLIGHYEHSNERKGVLFCIRNDSEKYYSDSQIQDLMCFFEKDTFVDKLDTTIRKEPSDIRNHIQKILEDYFEKFSRYKLIITDRYHGTIFSLIANTPVVVIKTKDHKVKTGIDWFKGCYDDQVFFAETLEQAKVIGEKILQRRSYLKNEALFEEKYYSRLRGLIEGEKYHGNMREK